MSECSNVVSCLPTLQQKVVLAVSIICVHLVCIVYDVIGLHSTVYVKLNTLSVDATVHLCIYNLQCSCYMFLL